MLQKRVLITGMSGLIGGAVRRQLEGRYELSALNRRKVEGVVCHRADIADLGAILPAFEGVDVVVHLAANLWGDWEELLQSNVIGTYNVFEACRRARVGRVVYASSGSTISGWERERPYKALAEGGEAPGGWEMLTHESPLRPGGLYGVTKVWGEALARHFSDKFGLSILCLRIGAVLQEDRPQQTRHVPVWCSQRDIARLVECCIEAPGDLKFDIFYGVSNNRRNYRDMEHAREVLGFVPADSVEERL